MKNPPSIFRVMLCASVVLTFVALSAAQDPCDPYSPNNTNINPNCGVYSGLPGQPDIPAATGTKLSAADALQFAYNTAKEAQSNPTGAVVDVAIAAISVGYPPAGLALGLIKGLFLSDSGPDPVGEALQNMNKRIDDLQNRIDGLQNKITGVQDDLFNFKNTTRTTFLQAHINSVKEVSVALHDHLPTNEFDSRATEIGDTANEFLRNRELWRWNDLEVKTDSSGVNSSHGLPDDFKALPAFEHYANALVLWMASLQYMSAGNPSYITGNPQTVKALLKHAAFLSVEPTWRADLPNDPVKNPDRTLPEQVMRRVRCSWSVANAYPDKTGMCHYSLACADYQRHLNTPLPDYKIPGRDPKGYCADLIPDPRAKTPSAVQLRDIAAHPRFGSESFQMWQDFGGPARQTGIPPLDAQLESIQNFYGMNTMAVLADRLARLARTGTTAEPWSPRFDMTSYSKETLYGVKANGELLQYGHIIGVDKNPPPPPSKAATPASVIGRVGAATQPEAGAAANRRIGTGARTGGVLTAQNQPQYRVIHKVEGPKLVGTGWQNFRQVIPAGGGSFYGLAADGSLMWYRHDGVNDGTAKWTGPVRVASGWNVFKQIIAGGDGVLYGVGADGSLQWYRHADFKDATHLPAPAPQTSGPKPLGKSLGTIRSLQGPRQVGTGWGNFVHVFSTGEGVLYGITPDGRLMWYRHLGYQNGTAQWQGPKQVGSGWANMKRVFSPEDGVIYAMPSTGELLWYKHDGYADGTPKWEGPTKIAVDWSIFGEVFPLMKASVSPSAVH